MSSFKPGLLCLGLILACRGLPPAVVPQPLPAVSTETVAAWRRATVPSGPILYRFRWRLTQENGEVIGGAGAARLAPPDSVRIDFAGPLGVHRTAALIIGDTIRWISPPENVNGWRPTVALAWSVLGLVRSPRGWACPAGLESSATRVWQCLQAADTVEVERRPLPARLATTRWWSEGRQVGEIQTWSNPDSTVARSVVTWRRPATRLEVTMKSVERLLAIPASDWVPPASE